MEQLITLITENYQDMLIVGAIMVSAIIFFIGILKPLLFNRITCKPLRKSLLAFSDILFSFIATAIYFVIEGLPWDIYYYVGGIVSLLTIITYWFYENTCLRNLIDKIGSLTIKKFLKVVTMLFNDAEKKEIEAEVEKITAEIKESTKKELKTATKTLKRDKELENL